MTKNPIKRCGKLEIWCFSALVVLIGPQCHSEIPSRFVNPPKGVSPSLKPYVYRFEYAVQENGFKMATDPNPSNIDLRLTFDKSLMSVTVVSELSFQGQLLVSSPTKNKEIWKKKGIDGTTRVAAERFSKAIADYVSIKGPLPLAQSRLDETKESGPAPISVYDEIRKLDQLRKEGLLTEEESQAQKERLLGSRP